MGRYALLLLLWLLPVALPSLEGRGRSPLVFRFTTPEYAAESARSFHLALRLAAAPRRETLLYTSSSDPRVVKPERVVRVHPGRRLAFLGLKAQRPGRAIVTVAADGRVAACTVTVRPNRRRPYVEILTPADGAVVWGTLRAHGRAWGAGAIRSLEWRLDGKRLAVSRSGSSEFGTSVAAAGRPGAHLLELRTADETGNVGTARARLYFAPRTFGDRTRSYFLDPTRLAAPRQFFPGFAPAAPTVTEVGDTGLRSASLYGSNQVLQFDVEAPAAGHYQLFVLARADHHLDHPALALVVDGGLFTPAATGPVTDTQVFRRHPIGGPFLLAAGRRRLSLFFYNDAYDPTTRSDRNCHVAAIELRHLGAARPDVIPPTAVMVVPHQNVEVGGAFHVMATGRDDDRVAELSIEIDGVVAARSAKQDLVERIPAGALRPGRHVLTAVAVDAAGNVGRSRPVTVERLPYRGEAPDDHLLFASQATAPIRLRVDQRAPGGQAFGLYSQGVPVTWRVFVRREGTYRVRLIARADLFETGEAWSRIAGRGRVARGRARPARRRGDAGPWRKGAAPPSRQLGKRSPSRPPPVVPAMARIVVGGRRVDVPVAGASYGWSPAADLRLSYGHNRITVTFTNDRYDPVTRRDRNLHLAGIHLLEKGVDRAAPLAAIVKPRPGEYVTPGELVVARTSDNGLIERVELLVDGATISTSGEPGLAGLWLHPARVSPGRRTLRVRAVDAEGNAGLSPPVTVTVLEPSRDAPLSATERGIHLLARLGLGHNRRELARLLHMGERRWLARQLAPEAGADGLALLTDRELMRNNLFDPRRLAMAGLSRALLTRWPVRERLALFFDNHFSTWVGKTGVLREWVEAHLFRALALGSFSDLLAASATSPAMLAYLDASANRAGSLNENYARELMELHTLGVDGGYTQKDVQEVSRVLTGWTETLGHPRYRFAFFAPHHDPGAKRALGVRFGGEDGLADGSRLLQILVAHPSTSRFVAAKLARTFVADRPPASVVERLAARFRATGGDVGTLVRQLVASPEFFARRHFGAKVKDPLELVIGLARNGLVSFDIAGVEFAVSRLGQPLYGCVTPDGYQEEGEAWLSSATMLARWNLAERLSRMLWLETLVGPATPDRPAGSLVDDLALSLTGRPLAPGSRAAVLRALAAGRTRGIDRVRAAAALILQMPRAQRN